MLAKIRIKDRLNESTRMRIRSLLPVAGLLVCILFFGLVTRGRVFSRSNMLSILNQCFSLVIAAIGGTFVYAHGGMDMSIGAVQAFCMLIGILVINATNAFIGLIAVLLLGVLCGLVTGGVHVSLGIPAFITSMCVKYICRGLVTSAVSTNSIKVAPSFYVFNNWKLKIIVLVVLLIVGTAVFERSKIGKGLKAIGGNSVAAAYDGIPVKRLVVLAYMILGFCMGLSAFLAIAREGAASAACGEGMELNMMLAISLGGLSFTGGASSHMSCAVIGSLIITILNNGMMLWGVPIEIVTGIKGILFLAVIAVTYERGGVNHGLI